METGNRNIALFRLITVLALAGSVELRSGEAASSPFSIEYRCCGEYVNIWDPTYSNAVMEVVLPRFSEFARKLSLPVPNPIMRSDVARFVPTPLIKHRDEVGGSCVLKNGFTFGFDRGHVASFASARAYFRQQDPDVVPSYYGKAEITRNEAVALAREAIQRLGYSPKDVLADLEPRIPPLECVGANVIPHYRIQWLDPRGGGPATEVEVDGQRGVIESLQFFGIALLDRPGPTVSVRPAPLPEGHPWRAMNAMGSDFNAEYAWKLVPFVMESIADWTGKLNLNVPLPVTTNQVRRFYVSDQGGWPHVQITLTNDWQFTFRNSALTYAGSPRRFFESDPLPFRVQDFAGQWRLSEAEAINLARREIAKLGHATGFVHTDFKPRIFRPKEIEGWPTIPRIQVEWNYPDVEHRTQWIQVEVDCGRGTVEALMFDDASFWNRPPPIDVPISLAAKADAGEKPPAKH